MKKTIEKFLEFNGRAISFLTVDGAWWVAIKPICEALGVHYKYQHERLQSDKILAQLSREHGMVAADGKLRKMVCLPEKYIYGWLFSINSESEGLLEFKRECYDVLFDHFHGGFRGKLKTDQIKNHARIEHLQKKVDEALSTDPNYKELNDLIAINIKIGQQVSKIDKEEERSQLDLFRTLYQ